MPQRSYENLVKIVQLSWGKGDNETWKWYTIMMIIHCDDWYRPLANDDVLKWLYKSLWTINLQYQINATKNLTKRLQFWSNKDTLKEGNKGRGDEA